MEQRHCLRKSLPTCPLALASFAKTLTASTGDIRGGQKHTLRTYLKRDISSSQVVTDGNTINKRLKNWTQWLWAIWQAMLPAMKITSGQPVSWKKRRMQLNLRDKANPLL